MTLGELNLDDGNTVEEFLALYGASSGRSIANALGLSGKGCVRVAKDLKAYAWNKKTAMGCRLAGNISSALMYEGICDRIYKGLPEVARW